MTCCSFENFDASSQKMVEAKMKAFVALCAGIEKNEIGNTLKDHINVLGIVKTCIKYIEVQVV